MQQRIDIPASHESVLRGDSDNSGHLIGILAICDKPSDGFGVISSDILNSHRIFRV